MQGSCVPHANSPRPITEACGLVPRRCHSSCSSSASSGLSLFLPYLLVGGVSAKAAPSAAAPFIPRPQLSLGGGGDCARKAAHVPHVRQHFNWDCGLACVLMVLRAAAPKAACMDLATLRQYCSTTRCAASAFYNP